jgi:hypothetical protein
MYMYCSTSVRNTKWFIISRGAIYFLYPWFVNTNISAILFQLPCYFGYTSVSAYISGDMSWYCSWSQTCPGSCSLRWEHKRQQTTKSHVEYAIDTIQKNSCVRCFSTLVGSKCVTSWPNIALSLFIQLSTCSPTSILDGSRWQIMYLAVNTIFPRVSDRFNQHLPHHVRLFRKQAT